MAQSRRVIQLYEVNEAQDWDRPLPRGWLPPFSYCAFCGMRTGKFRAPHVPDCPGLRPMHQGPEPDPHSHDDDDGGWI